MSHVQISYNSRVTRSFEKLTPKAFGAVRRFINDTTLCSLKNYHSKLYLYVILKNSSTSIDFPRRNVFGGFGADQHVRT